MGRVKAQYHPIRAEMPGSGEAIKEEKKRTATTTIDGIAAEFDQEGSRPKRFSY